MKVRFTCSSSLLIYVFDTSSIYDLNNSTFGDHRFAGESLFARKSDLEGLYRHFSPFLGHTSEYTSFCKWYADTSFVCKV